MRKKSRYGLFLGVGLTDVIGVWLIRDPLRNRIAQSAALANPTPPPELAEEIIAASPDRHAAILAAWNTGRIVHRQAAVREISRAFPVGQSMPAELESIVLKGALDVDMSVGRTRALRLTQYFHENPRKEALRRRDIRGTMQTKSRASRRLLRVAVRWRPRVFFRAVIRKPGFLRGNGGSGSTQTRGRIRPLAHAGLCLMLALLLSGCSTRAVRQQRLVARPNMTFSDSVAFSYNSSRLLPQLDTGFAAAGGPQNSGCTSCR